MAEIKPDTFLGIRKMEPQMNGYMEHVKSYNSNLSVEMGMEAPIVQQHRFYYSESGIRSIRP